MLNYGGPDPGPAWLGELGQDVKHEAPERRSMAELDRAALISAGTLLTVGLGVALGWWVRGKVGV